MRPSRRALLTGLPAIAGTADEGLVSWGRHANAVTRCSAAARLGSSDRGAARLLRSACLSCSHSGPSVRVPPKRHLRSLKTPSSWGRSMSPLCRGASHGSKGRRPYSPHPFRHRHPLAGRHAFVRRHPLPPRHPFRRRTAVKAAPPRRRSTRKPSPEASAISVSPRARRRQPSRSSISARSRIAGCTPPRKPPRPPSGSRPEMLRARRRPFPCAASAAPRSTRFTTVSRSARRK
jgi:hypothetical protein